MLLLIYTLMLIYFAVKVYLISKSQSVNKKFSDNKNNVFNSIFSYRLIDNQMQKIEEQAKDNHAFKKQSCLKASSLKICKFDQIIEMLGNVGFNLVSLMLTINNMTDIKFLCIPIIFNTINCAFIYWRPSIPTLID